MQNITIKLSDEMLHDIEIVSKKIGKTKSWIIRSSLEDRLSEYRYIGVLEKNYGNLIFDANQKPLIIPEKNI